GRAHRDQHVVGFGVRIERSDALAQQSRAVDLWIVEWKFKQGSSFVTQQVSDTGALHRAIRQVDFDCAFELRLKVFQLEIAERHGVPLLRSNESTPRELPKLPKLPKIAEIAFCHPNCAPSDLQFGFFGNCQFWQLIAGGYTVFSHCIGTAVD